MGYNEKSRLEERINALRNELNSLEKEYAIVTKPYSQMSFSELINVYKTESLHRMSPKQRVELDDAYDVFRRQIKRRNFVMSEYLDAYANNLNSMVDYTTLRLNVTPKLIEIYREYTPYCCEGRQWEREQDWGNRIVLIISKHFKRKLRTVHMIDLRK